MRSALVGLLLAIGCGGGGSQPGVVDGAGNDAVAANDGGGDDDAPIDSAIDAPVIPTCPTGQWCTETAPSPGILLSDVWAVSATDVFVVGDAGTILRRTDNQWATMASGTASNLRGVWATSSSDVWAVGEAGVALHFNGSVWSLIPTNTTANLHAVWGASTGDVWITGAGILLHWNGSGFAATGRAGEIFAIDGNASNDIYAAGENTRPIHFNGTAWTSIVDPNLGTTNFSVVAIAANDVWIGGFVPNKETIHFTTAWSNVAAAGCVFQGFYGRAANDIWAGGGTRIGHWNGTTWTIEMPNLGSSSIYGVAGSGSFVWMVGSDSLILHRN